MTTKTRPLRRLTGCTWFQLKPRKCCFWVLLLPVRAEPYRLLNTPVSINCVWRCRQSPVFGRTCWRAATTLAAGKSYGIYKVMLTEEELRRLGLSA